MSAVDDRPLAGKVAVVTGGSRGAGRGIALELGAAGATVFVSGRSRGAERPPEYDSLLATGGMRTLPGSIEETAEAVTRAGGRGVAVRCDHTKEDEVRALFAQVEREGGRLDLLVNNAWGGNALRIGDEPFWEQPMAHWDGMFDRGVLRPGEIGDEPARLWPRAGAPAAWRRFGGHLSGMDADRVGSRGLRGGRGALAGASPTRQDRVAALRGPSRGGAGGGSHGDEQDRRGVSGGRSGEGVWLHRRGWEGSAAIRDVSARETSTAMPARCCNRG